MGKRLASCAALLWLLPVIVSAEPYLAIDKGLQCSACHTHAGGAGMRTTYGNIYAQTEMASLIADSDKGYWNGEIAQWLRIGANLRGRFEYTDDGEGEDQSAFDVVRGDIYVQASFMDDKLSVYFDQQVAPSSSINREAYVQLKGKKFRLTGGQFYLPYGWRLQDDTAFVRRTTGVNMSNPDRGVQLGYESGRWSHALAVTNGSGGGSETDDGKQLSLLTSFNTGRWRIGVSANHNDSDLGDRSMANIFGGIRTGRIAWLFELDAIRDELPDGSDQDGLAGIVEANWLYRRGHNVKVSYEYFDPDSDTSEDHQNRWSALYEWTPLPFLQARFGARINDGPPQVSGSDLQQWFAEIHGFF